MGFLPYGYRKKNISKRIAFGRLPSVSVSTYMSTIVLLLTFKFTYTLITVFSNVEDQQIGERIHQILERLSDCTSCT